MKNKYEIRGEKTFIFVNCKGKVVEYVIDTDDLPLVSSFPNTWQSVLGYAVGFTNRGKGQKAKVTRMHRLIMNCPDDMVVDHIDGNKRNNTRSNLRVVTHTQNKQNIKNAKNTKSQFKNVNWNKSKNRWDVIICVNKKRYYIGGFKDLEEAKIVAIDARSKLSPFSIESTKEIDISEIAQQIKEKYKTKAFSSNKTSGVRGVSWSNYFNKWRADAVVNGKRKCSFHTTLEKAIEARKKFESNTA